jgi:hypothetical protein
MVQTSFNHSSDVFTHHLKTLPRNQPLASPSHEKQKENEGVCIIQDDGALHGSNKTFIPGAFGIVFI